MENGNSEEITVIQATTSTREDLNWIEYQTKEKQETLKRLEETAKYLSGLSSVSLAIMVGPNNEVFKQLNHSFLLKLGIISWLVSILFTLAVLFPFRYKYSGNSAQSIRYMVKRTAGVKYALLIGGTFFYLAGICITVFLYIFK
jgi:hypothetical protein